MNRLLKSFGLRSRGAQYQFGIGVALLSIIPLLALAYLFYGRLQFEAAPPWQVLVVVFAVPFVGLSGYLVLRKYPVNILRLRRYMENIVSGEIPDHITLLDAEDDISAIEKCMNMMISRLRHKVDTAEAEKAHLTAQLYHAQKMESLGLMAGGVAHDFGNLLQGIMGHATLAKDALSPDSPVREDIASIETAATQASNLVNQMLIYAGKGVRHTTSLDMSEHIRGLEPLLRTTCPRSSVALSYNLARDVPGIEADPTQISQLILNLVINASEAIGKGNKGSVAISSGIRNLGAQDREFYSPAENLRSGTYVFAEVRDSGAGISEETQARIFDPFFTTKVSGRGLGLAVVMGIVKSHNGLLRVSSSPGKGAAFTVLFPARQRQPAGNSSVYGDTPAKQ